MSLVRGQGRMLLMANEINLFTLKSMKFNRITVKPKITTKNYLNAKRTTFFMMHRAVLYVKIPKKNLKIKLNFVIMK